jgi:sugar lactone lactonase YvrE
VINGPNSYAKIITATTTLTGLGLGSYYVRADSASAPDSIVGSVIDTATVTGTPALLQTHDTTRVTVTYATERHLGGLWVAANNQHSISEFPSAGLHVSDTLVVGDSIGALPGHPSGIAFDSAGNLWVSSYSSDTILMWTAANRATGGQTPDRIIGVAPQGGKAENLAFDKHGNLWIAYCSSGSLAALSPAQLSVSASGVAPSISITATDMSCAWATAFDSTGNLWVADPVSNLLIEFSKAQLGTSGVQMPPVEISDNGTGSVGAPHGLGFDATGTLWVADLGDTINAFSSSELAASGSPTPQTTVVVNGAGELFGAAFDRRGTLWLSDDDFDQLLGMTTAQLTAGGAQTPAVFAVLPNNTGGWSPEQLAFDPMATSPFAPARIRPHPVGASRIPAHPAHPNANRLNRAVGR